MANRSVATGRRKVVVGGTYNHFREWLHENGLTHLDAIFADSRERIVGLELKAEDIVRLGPISDALELELKLRIR